jgi:hypothetical protein
MSVDLALYIVAFVCFVVKGFSVNTGRVDLWPLGWAALVLSLIV